MASKFYLISGLSTPFSIKGTWEITDNTTTIPLSLVKSGGAISTRSNSEGTTPVPNDVMQLQLVSPKLGVQTFSGDLTFTLGVKAPYDTSRYFWHIHAYVTQGDTDLVRGTLINNYRESGSINFWSVSASSSIPLLSIPLNAGVTSVAGDRVVVEVGYISRVAPTLLAGTITGKVKVAGPVSSVSLTFPSPPTVNSGIVVMVAGHKDSAGMAFGTCTDNRGNTYSIATPAQHVTSSGTFAVIMYYCSKIINTGSPFTITVTGDGSDHAFVASAVEVTGLNNGLLTLGNVSRTSSVTATTIVDTGNAISLANAKFFAAIFARFVSAGSIGINTDDISWIESHKELITTWNQSICSEADFGFAGNGVSANWNLDTVSHFAASFASFIATAGVVGTGDIYLGAPTGSADLVHPSGAVGTNAGSITFSQNLLLEGIAAEVAHVVEQVAQVLPPPELQLAHTVIQAAKPAPPPVHLAHTVVQVANTAPAVPSQVSHLIAQVALVLPSTTARISHAIIQVVPIQVAALPDLSGLYYLNPTKSFYHDSYYNSTELKIPDPTIKTAFLGE